MLLEDRSLKLCISASTNRTQRAAATCLPAEHSFRCECGRPLQVEGATKPEPPFVVVFCDLCYLNHRFERRSGRLVLVQRYYFPDD
jgi:hypothetical protein